MMQKNETSVVEGKLTVTDDHLLVLASALIESGYDIAIRETNTLTIVQGDPHKLYLIGYKTSGEADFATKEH